jgi:hypothetical protein
MRNLVKLGLAGAAFAVFAAGSVLANGGPHLPPLDLYKRFIQAPSETGWVIIQDLPERQVLHFAPLVGWTCGISEVRYSVNSDALDQRVDMPECDGTYLLHLPRNRPEILASVDLAPGTARSVTMQVVFADNSVSDVRSFGPCDGIGKGICSRTLTR